MKKKMSISKKLMVSFISISALSIVVGSIAIFNLRTLNEYNNRLYEKELLGLSYIKEADIDINNMIRAEKNILLAPTVEQRDAALKRRDHFKEEYSKNIEAGRALFYTELGATKLAIVDAAYKDWIVTQDQVIAIANTEKLSEASASTALSMGESKAKADALGTALTELTELKIQNAQRLSTEGSNAFVFSLVLMISIITLGFAMGIILGIVISRSITRPVTKFVTTLKESSEQIGVSSGQLSKASIQIASGAQEQASQIEEITASMEELSSMVKQNVENSKTTSLLAALSKTSSTTGFDQMEKMVDSMQGIAKSAENIRGVIDVIDDIAFQTNMLALNAAVEAARAGEAGMGFAVVADEVKNLANRSASSAKETGAMIKESIQKIDDGMNIAKKLAEVFKEIVTNSTRLSEMSKEVETASRQQDEGIDQVNKAIIQFDTVVQANASASEETASSAEELQSQAESLNNAINDLHLIDTMVEGAASMNTFKTAGRPQDQDDNIPLTFPPQKRIPTPRVYSTREAPTERRPQLVASSNGKHHISFENDEEFSKF